MLLFETRSDPGAESQARVLWVHKFLRSGQQLISIVLWPSKVEEGVRHKSLILYLNVLSRKPVITFCLITVLVCILI